MTSSSMNGSYAITRRPNGFARLATARATWPNAISPSVWPIRRGICSSAGRPSRQRPSRTILSCSIVRRNVDSSSIIAWSATSSMKVSGQFVTGMPRAVAAFTSTLSTPTLPSTMARQRSGSASTTFFVKRMPLA